MSLPTLSESLQSRIEIAIQLEANALRDKLIEQAISEFEIRLRRAVGEVTLSVMGVYSIERVGAELLIRVKIE